MVVDSLLSETGKNVLGLCATVTKSEGPEAMEHCTELSKQVLAQLEGQSHGAVVTILFFCLERVIGAAPSLSFMSGLEEQGVDHLDEDE